MLGAHHRYGLTPDLLKEVDEQLAELSRQHLDQAGPETRQLGVAVQGTSGLPLTCNIMSRWQLAWGGGRVVAGPQWDWLAFSSATSLTQTSAM